MSKKIPCVYIITNKNNTVLYVGVTNDLLRRVYEHKNKQIDGFSKQYNLEKLVYYEFHNNMIEAIKREKQIKGGSRQRKKSLINEFNPDWNDLYDTLT